MDKDKKPEVEKSSGIKVYLDDTKSMGVSVDYEFPVGPITKGGTDFVHAEMNAIVKNKEKKPTNIVMTKEQAMLLLGDENGNFPQEQLQKALKSIPAFSILQDINVKVVPIEDLDKLEKNDLVFVSLGKPTYDKNEFTGIPLKQKDESNSSPNFALVTKELLDNTPKIDENVSSQSLLNDTLKNELLEKLNLHRKSLTEKNKSKSNI